MAMMLRWDKEAAGSLLLQSLCIAKILLQFRVFRFGLLQDGDVGVGVFPEGEEVLVFATGVGKIALEGISAGETDVGQRACWVFEHESGVTKNLLELCDGYASIA